MSSSFLFGTPETTEQFPTLTGEQGQYLQQLMQMLSSLGPEVQNYFKDLFSEDPQAFEKFAAPAKREFEEQIIPGIAERFTGMGMGAQDSSGFQQSLGQAGAGLSERLAALREGLKSQGISQLQGMSGQGLGTRAFETAVRPRQPGFLENILGPAIGAAGKIGGAYAGRPG